MKSGFLCDGDTKEVSLSELQPMESIEIQIASMAGNIIPLMMMGNIGTRNWRRNLFFQSNSHRNQGNIPVAGLPELFSQRNQREEGDGASRREFPFARKLEQSPMNRIFRAISITASLKKRKEIVGEKHAAEFPVNAVFSQPEFASEDLIDDDDDIDQLSEFLNQFDYQITDPAEIEKMVEKVLFEYPKQLEQYRNGKTKLEGFFAAEVMEDVKGKANPGLLNKILQEKLNA